MRIVGLDVGTKTIGVAISDIFGWTAQGLSTIYWREKDITSADEHLAELHEKEEVEKVVVGLPKHMNGSIGERGEASEVYDEDIEKAHHIPTVFWDERLTTVAEQKVLLEADVSRKKRKDVIDKMAAV